MTIDAGETGVLPTSRKAVTISFETLTCLLIGILAAAIRWINLGSAPLSSAEAPQAIAAWHALSPGAAPGVGAVDSILVHAGTIISFAVSGPNGGAARAVSALAGTALVLSPLLFRHRLGRLGTILCMVFLAVSPSAVIDSRTMTGVGIAMLGAVALLAAIDRYIASGQRAFAILAGVALAIMLMADFGGLAILVMLAAGGAMAAITDEEGDFSGDALQEYAERFPWTAALIGLGTTVALLSTVFYLAPSGLAVAADQLARFFGGLVSRPADTPYLGLVIFAYEPFLLVFGLIAAWTASQSTQSWQRFVAGWAIAALIISLAYPGAMPAHSLWATVPMAVLVATLIAGMLEAGSRAPVKAVAIEAAGTVALIAMTLGSLARQLSSPQVIPIGSGETSVPYDIILIIMWLILASVLFLTISSVWGARAAWRGLGLGATLAGLAASIGLSAAMSFTRPTSPYELFNRQPADPTLPVLVSTAEDISLIASTDRHDAQIIVQGSPDGVLAWVLRDFHHVQFVSSIPASTQSVMVITSAEGTHPELGSNYVGQSFIITRGWSVAGLDLQRFLIWLIYRTDAAGPTVQERVILWVREDVYQLVPKK